MRRTPRIFTDGICTDCKEHTQVGFPCCNAPVEFEGGSMTRETAYEADCSDGLVCECKRCAQIFDDGDAPCGINHHCDNATDEDDDTCAFDSDQEYQS